jgi:hypothetical protein
VSQNQTFTFFERMMDFLTFESFSFAVSATSQL